jgi:hypothetical protein
MAYSKLTFTVLLPFFAISVCLSAAGASMQYPADTYKSEIDRLCILEHYRPMKNSFVLGLETACGLPLAVKKGERKVILEAKGCGSIRHIWETHGPGPAPFELEFFIDGEKTPSIKGRLIDLINAAKKCDQNFIKNTGGVIANDSYNLYLPIPFEKSVRIDLVSVEQMGLIFMQLDYRLEDNSMRGIRLIQKGQGEKTRFAYTGTDSAKNNVQANAALRKETFEFEGNGTAIVKGQGVIRRFMIEPNDSDARLRIRFDENPSAAADVDLRDFFGLFKGAVINGHQSYFPMPFKKQAQFEIAQSDQNVKWKIEIDIEDMNTITPNMGYFHAVSSRTDTTGGYEPFTVLYTKGRGKWVGMSLYKTGHDHGGGDFAIVDGEADTPSFLHGINGEDYFSFAFFGKGENFPYSEAFDNDTGRMRLHLENPYPFSKSIYIGWGELKGQSPRGVALWYQDSPSDLTLSGEQVKGREWLVFGPVAVKGIDTSAVLEPDTLFAALPSEKSLDAGMEFEAEHLMFSKRFTAKFKGWAKQTSVGNHLNLMYIYGHVMDLGDHHHIGYHPRAMMAKTIIKNPHQQTAAFQLSYDDPLVVYLNGNIIYQDMNLSDDFKTRLFKADLKQEQNNLLIKLLDTPNNNTCWAGISLRILDAKGSEMPF